MKNFFRRKFQEILEEIVKYENVEKKNFKRKFTKNFKIKFQNKNCCKFQKKIFKNEILEEKLHDELKI